MDEEQLKIEAVNFYVRLYEEQPGLIIGLPPNALLHLSDRDLNVLNKAISDEKIKFALFDMAPLKSLESDGYHALFYQSQWHHVDAFVCRWIKEVFFGEY